MKMLPDNIKFRIFGWISLLFITVILYLNQKTLLVYYNYAWYQLNAASSDKIDAVGDLNQTIDAAKEAGYHCKNKQVVGTFADREIARRKSLLQSYLHKIKDCVELPTGEIIIHVNDGLARTYILLKVDVSRLDGYQILDIRGETLG